MIVLDSSILVGILKGEQDASGLLTMLSAEEWCLGAPTLVETRSWCAMNVGSGVSRWLEAAIDADNVSVLPFGRDMADSASQAFRRFGRGSGHKARLNFGDCMSYAVSAVLRAPLLYKGADFGLTDVMKHPASIEC